MATTIQVVENLTVGRYIEIEGKRCEVEAASFSCALIEKAHMEELLSVMSKELTERDIIAKDEAGCFYWKASGEPLVPNEDWED